MQSICHSSATEASHFPRYCSHGKGVLNFHAMLRTSIQSIPAHPRNHPPITSHSPSQRAAERSDQPQSVDNRSMITGLAALFISIFFVIPILMPARVLDQTLSFRALALRARTEYGCTRAPQAEHLDLPSSSISPPLRHSDPLFLRQ